MGRQNSLAYSLPRALHRAGHTPSLRAGSARRWASRLNCVRSVRTTVSRTRSSRRTRTTLSAGSWYGLLDHRTLSILSQKQKTTSQVYYPIFGKEQVRASPPVPSYTYIQYTQQDHYLQQIVSPFKDVEGLNYKFHYNLYHKLRPPCSPSHLPSALTCTQHPLPRAEVPPRVLALSRSGSTADQRCRPATRNRQVDPTVHAPRRRESARARRGVQRAATLRRSSLRSHRNRHQPVNPPLL